MAIDWQEIIKTLGGYTVFLTAAAWLIRQLVSNRFVRDAEKFRITIQSNADTEIERVKHSLQKEAVEHQVRFSKLHEKRVEVISMLYTRLMDVHEVAEDYVVGGTWHDPANPKEEYSKAMQRARELLDFF